jgi:hypothetical protein
LTAYWPTRAEPARGRNVGGSLLPRCRQVYFARGSIILNGQMPPTPGLDTFYRRNGFEVLDSGEGLDRWPVFGVHSRVDTDPGERFFIRYRPQP